jgi:hypothetical protein
MWEERPPARLFFNAVPAAYPEGSKTVGNQSSDCVSQDHRLQRSIDSSVLLGNFSAVNYSGDVNPANGDDAEDCVCVAMKS